MASRFLADVELGSDEMRENVAHHMAYAHESVDAATVAYLEQAWVRLPADGQPGKSWMEASISREALWEELDGSEIGSTDPPCRSAKPWILTRNPKPEPEPETLTLTLTLQLTLTSSKSAAPSIRRPSRTHTNPNLTLTLSPTLTL